MTGVDWQRQLRSERDAVNRRLRDLIRTRSGIPPRLRQAMRHSLLAGGKRLRPVLVLWARDAVAAGSRRRAVDRDDVLSAACAVEMLHTYSLIHDDLPAMDDDVLRRGRPTCHVAFDEATAILAGDGLQALAFELLAVHSGALAGRVVARMARDVGPAGMVGGQQFDLDAEGTEPTAALVRRIHRRKTGALLAGSLAVGALLGGADGELEEELHAAGEKLGLAFQGADDLLDVSASAASLGKSPGKDEEQGKATWIRVEGKQKARARTLRDGRAGVRLLVEALPAGDRTDRLVRLGEMMWNRDQ